jgi:hypothetical protein
MAGLILTRALARSRLMRLPVIPIGTLLYLSNSAIRKNKYTIIRVLSMAIA